jgi:hypothetical protein
VRALLLVAILGCAGSPKRALPPEHDAPAEPPHAPDSATDPAPTDDGVLTGLDNGDRACYVVLHRPSGDARLPGDFELCAGGAYDATALVGQRVRIATKKTPIQATSCQGNPDCADSELVDLVIAILPAP